MSQSVILIPLLPQQMQQDMETKMQALLAEMERAQKQVGAGESSGQSGQASRLEHLEQQVKELTERRLQHLETLQSQQMEVQVREGCAMEHSWDRGC